MNKLPEDLPPLPEGAVPLGFGGEFVIPENQKFDGYMWEFGDENWFAGNMVNGKYQDIFYAAPAGSEVARLNGLGDNRPSWYDAPDWAEWLAQDKPGSWWWYEKKPEPIGNMFLQCNFGEDTECARAKGEYKPNPNWRETLERRPQSEPQPITPDILIPPELIGWFEVQRMTEMGYRLEIDQNGLRGYKDDE